MAVQKDSFNISTKAPKFSSYQVLQLLEKDSPDW